MMRFRQQRLDLASKDVPKERPETRQNLAHAPGFRINFLSVSDPPLG